MVELPPRLKVLYPFEQKQFAAPGGNLNYVDTGDGHPVVMIHGNPTWSFFYRDLILGLQDSHRCLALDNLGCGLSEKPQQGDYSLAAHVGRATAWIKSTGIGKFHLVVHDWGGPIGLGMADRLRDRVTGITIFNTAAFEFPGIPLRIAACRIPFLGATLVRGANAFVRGAAHMTTVEPLSRAVREGFTSPYGNWHGRVAIHAFVRDIPMRKSHPSWNTLKSIEASLPEWKKVPVQIIWGMRDWCFHGGILDRWEEILPGARVHRFERAGHYLLEDAGEAIIPLVRNFVAGS
ncbi:MAG: alpha/beta fold hydrolase [Opitutales bacterium]